MKLIKQSKDWNNIERIERSVEYERNSQEDAKRIDARPGCGGHVRQEPGSKKHYDEMEPDYQLKAQIVEAQIAKGLSQKELAKLVGTQQSSVSRYKREDCLNEH